MKKFKNKNSKCIIKMAKKKIKKKAKKSEKMVIGLTENITLIGEKSTKRVVEKLIQELTKAQLILT